MKRYRAQRGYTLIELMLVIGAIALMAAIAQPRLSTIILDAHVREAYPYLMAIAARERAYFNRHGAYYTSPANDEQDLEDNLGVDLSAAGDFCFLVRSGFGSYISSSGDDEASFEVWAVLRDGNYTGGLSNNDSVAVYQSTDGVVCHTADFKGMADGWVQTNSDAAGSEGRVVALREPAPQFDLLDTANRQNRPGFKLDWTDGIASGDVFWTP